MKEPHTLIKEELQTSRIEIVHKGDTLEYVIGQANALNLTAIALCCAGAVVTLSPSEIKEMPANFKQWQKTNASRIQGAMERDTLPHWYRDNQALIGGLNYEDIAAKLKEGVKPFQPNAYVSFEPFSPAIIEAIRKAKDRKAKNAIFESILNDPRATTLYTTRTAKTTIYPNHKGIKGRYWNENQMMAKVLNDGGVSVSFLPEMESLSCADALIKHKGQWKLVDFKVSGKDNYNTIAEELIKGYTQAKTIVFQTLNGNANTIYKAVEQIQRKGIRLGEMIIITPKEKVIAVSAKDFRSGRYKKLIKGKM